MPVNPSTQKDGIRSFWHRYTEMVSDSGVKTPCDAWMVRRAEHLGRGPSRPPPGRSDPAEVDAYLADLGRKPALKDWQFRKAVDAIQIFRYCFATGSRSS